MINTKLQSIIDTKSAIGNAIVNKGGTITGETPFFNYAAQIDGISTGTPQTIFAASDGSKWALTNVVNLTNVSNNVTYDFNRWQPANNSTSDPILNVGTVNGNISGNIQLVQVNQVNIAQYSNIVINDTTGAKYVGYNGYDANTNPTPTGNTTFNRWLLNNSASGTVLFANTTVVNGGTFNGPNTSITTNITNVAFINNTATYNGLILSVFTNNGFIYAGGSDTPQTNGSVKKYYESNLAFVGNTTNFTSGYIQAISINNGFIYAGGGTNQRVVKFGESNLSFVQQSVNYGGDIFSLTTNNGFVYVGGWGPSFSNGSISKFHESNLALVGNTVNYGGLILSLTTNNGFIYVVGGTNQRVKKFYESNLAFVGNSASYGGDIRSVTTNNGFIYVGGFTNQTVQKFYESNLAFVGNTVSYGGYILTISANNGFIYVGGGGNNAVSKFYESNLALVVNTASYGGDIRSLTTNNGFIYVGGAGNNGVRKFQEQETTIILDNQTFYTATKIKE
jgi:hypothetical protein